ncbi:hypothetical protein PC129_g17141 [Phytophthora cactorum]|nr:hypothetical protein PC117_g11793 [Phytophthora cactorum]KAG3002457.1 hypothetical protein PC120_g19727 [Phytophthora cactorum]KAG3015756.1 hypothetical protein PC119_g11639 [Phytophthora cactorum]KAG3165408.1 hypothetical protein C6341_g12392 [Phytophthora cactorum]KAG3187217.1 hypothetical protein PC128_g12703 [Phytophthora cactorum]
MLGDAKAPERSLAACKGGDGADDPPTKFKDR